MRPPSKTIVIDAAILIAAVRGRCFIAITAVANVLSLATTSRALEEAQRRIEFGLKRPDLLPILWSLTEDILVVPPEALEPLLPDSEAILRFAVASQNGSVKDAHLVALARDLDADVWTTDRDFAGTGIASWSTTNLMRALV